MPLTDKQRAAVAKLAEEWGEDPDELASEVESMTDDDAPADDKADKTPDKAPDKAKPAEESTDGANGGKGFYAYQYPFLTVNEVRKSLELGDAPDGDLFTGQWLAKHAGPTAPVATTPEDGNE